MAYRLYGSDMDDTTTPLEAGLAWVVKLDKGDFVGRDALRPPEGEQGVARKLVGFALTDPGIARHGYPVLQDGRKVGEVTSGTKSPTLGDLDRARLRPDGAGGGGLHLRRRDPRPAAAAARVVKTPFYVRK